MATGPQLDISFINDICLAFYMLIIFKENIYQHIVNFVCRVLTLHMYPSFRSVALRS